MELSWLAMDTQQAKQYGFYIVARQTTRLLYAPAIYKRI